jgi:glutathione S-transferase
VGQGANFNPEYLRINPDGTVPTLTDGEKKWTDSTVRSLLLPIFRVHR